MGYTRKMRRYGTVVLLAAMLTVAGCGSSTLRYVNPDANFSYIKKIAVLPLNNFSDDRYAGEKVRGVLTVDLLSRHAFELVEQGQVTKILASVLGSAGYREGRAVELDSETLKLLGEKLGVQAVIMGSVDEYRGSRGGAAVSLSMRLVDTGSGIVLWQTKSTVLGDHYLRRMFGIGIVDSTKLTRVAVKRALDTLL